MSYTFSAAIAVVSFTLLAATNDHPVCLEPARLPTRPQPTAIVAGGYTKTVPKPPSASDLISQLESAIAAAPDVSDNLRHPLTTKLDAAIAALAKNKSSVACVALGDFRDQVVEKRGKGIPAPTADEWLATVGQISTLVGCSIVC
jgi:hypothetical protein